MDCLIMGTFAYNITLSDCHTVYAGGCINLPLLSSFSELGVEGTVKRTKLNSSLSNIKFNHTIRRIILSYCNNFHSLSPSPS